MKTLLPSLRTRLAFICIAILGAVSLNSAFGGQRRANSRIELGDGVFAAAPAATPVSGGGGIAPLSTTTDTIQTGNFDAEQKRIPSGGSAGAFNQSATEVGLFAHGGSGGTNETLFKTYRTTADTSGAARTLQIGDNFSITMFSATNPFGFAGVYFDDNLTYTAYSNYNSNERTAVVLGPSGNWVVENNGTSVDTGIGANNSITAALTVTSSNTFNMAITNNTNSVTTTYYDLVMKNAPGTANRIQSFALALQNDNSANFFVKNGSLTNTGSVTIGGSNLSLTISGVITDGLDSASTSTNSVNSLTKIGSGTMVLGGANTYTGATTINAGTLSISSDGNLGTAPGSATANSLNFSPATNGSAALATTADMTLNSNRGITLNSVSGATNFIGVASGTTLTYGGIIAGSGFFVKNQPGTLLLTGNNTFGGTNNIFLDEGTVAVGTGGNLGATNGTTTGLISMGSSTVGGLNTTLNIANSGVTLANPVVVRYLQTGAKTISGTFTSGSSTYSGAISLADHLSIAAANGGTLLFTGVISQAAGTGSATPGVGFVNNTSPTGGFSTNGPGVIINSGASSTGIVEYDNAMSYQGDTVVNSGTLQFNGSGSLLNSSIRLGALGPATLNLISPTGSTLNVTVNVRSANSIISASNTSGTSTLGGHFALDANGTVQEASSTGTLAITQAHTDGATAKTGTDIKGFTLTLAPTGTINVSGDIYNSTGSGNVLSNGAGTSILSGTNTYLGTTTVSSGGKLFINGNQSAATGAVSVNNSGTTLGGSGTIGGSVNVASGANLSPGASGVGSTAILHTGALTLNSTSNFNVDLNNTTVGTGYDQVSVTGAVNLGGTLASNLVVSAGAGLAVGNKFFILLNDSTDLVSGTFAQGTTVTSGADVFLINYADNGDGGGTPNDISLTVTAIPEPSTCVGAVLALGAMALAHTHRRRFARR